jgi:hypothetical protein
MLTTESGARQQRLHIVAKAIERAGEGKEVRGRYLWRGQAGGSRALRTLGARFASGAWCQSIGAHRHRGTASVGCIVRHDEWIRCRDHIRRHSRRASPERIGRNSAIAATVLRERRHGDTPR